MYVPPRSREKLRLPVGCPPRYCAQRAHNAHRRDATRCTAIGEGRCTGTYLSTSHLCVSFARTRARIRALRTSSGVLSDTVTV